MWLAMAMAEIIVKMKLSKKWLKTERNIWP
jgi:hypothetical protein